MLSDRVNIHLSNFERSHRDDFSYELVKEGFRIQRFDLIFERRPHHGWDYYRDKQGLGSIRLSPLGSSLTELVMEDSSSLDADPIHFIGAFDYVKTWVEDEEDDPSHPRMSFDEAKKLRQIDSNGSKRFMKKCAVTLLKDSKETESYWLNNR